MLTRNQDSLPEAPLHKGALAELRFQLLEPFGP